MKSDWIIYSYEPSDHEIFLKIWTGDNLKIKITIDHNTAIKYCPSMCELGCQVMGGLPHQSKLMTPVQHWNQWHSGQCNSTQPSSEMSQGGQCWKQTFSPSICNHFLLLYFLIFVLLIISLDNDTVRSYFLPVKHTYRTVLLLSCKSRESKILFNIFSCNQIH